MNMDFTLFTPTKLLFGRGKLGELASQQLPGEKALLLISSGKSVRANGTLDRVTAQLDKAGVAYTICANIHENPSREVVMEAAACAKANGCDFVLAVGGGAVLDSAVAVAAMATNPGDLWDYVCGGTGKGQPLQHPGLPIVTVATTSGTGSEINCWGVISNHATNEKIGFGYPELNPVLAIVDPELMLTLPKGLTAATGMDALTHAVEAYLSRFYNTKQTRLLAEHAVVAIFTHLERAYRDGTSLPDRAAMLQASFDAGAAFTRASVGNVHAIAHTLGGLYGVPHGLANAVLLPLVLEDYGKAAYPRLARLAALVGLKGDTEEVRAKAFIAEIRAMNTRMGIPDHFDCIRKEDIPLMATWAAQEANPVYPVPVIYDEARFARVIERSHHSQ